MQKGVRELFSEQQLAWPCLGVSVETPRRPLKTLKGRWFNYPIIVPLIEPLSSPDTPDGFSCLPRQRLKLDEGRSDVARLRLSTLLGLGFRVRRFGETIHSKLSGVFYGSGESE